MCVGIAEHHMAPGFLILINFPGNGKSFLCRNLFVVASAQTLAQDTLSHHTRSTEDDHLHDNSQSLRDIRQSFPFISLTSEDAIHAGSAGILPPGVSAAHAVARLKPRHN
jgi:hypothetical protein